jgi:hypothetical protein
MSTTSSSHTPEGSCDSGIRLFVSEHPTAREAFAEVERLAQRLRDENLLWDAAGEMYVCDENRQAVTTDD